MANRTKKQPSASERVLDARPDTIDFRDKMYVPTLVEVPLRRPLTDFKRAKVPILDQGTEGACTGFGLAAVANYLLRVRQVDPDRQAVSPRMLYEMAKRYDEWAGEKYSGSSARGAMKGWHKHGVCGEEKWRYSAPDEAQTLTSERAADAVRRPLGAYFRVNHRDLVAMHAAISEVGILYASATVHSGWDRVNPNGGDVPFPGKPLGGHAFAIVGYEADGFWIQNSWGRGWGRSGFALLSYDDWMENGTDVWVARLGVPIVLFERATGAATRSSLAGGSESYSQHELRPHVISIGNDGRLRDSGPFGTSSADVEEILQRDFPRVTRLWRQKRVLIYAHGGLVSESAAIQRLAEYRAVMLGVEVFPIGFAWKSDYWTTISNILKDAIQRRRPEGFLDTAKDFMLDRLDDALEPIARNLTGKAAWDEMKENALRATTAPDGGARIVAKQLSDLIGATDAIELHLVAHSAGAIFLAPLVQLLTGKGRISKAPMDGETGLGRKISSCALWGPACTIASFRDAYLPAIQDGSIESFALFTLTDDAEQRDNCAAIYNKSLLYLVSNAFEDRCRIPMFRPQGEPILGMAKFVEKDRDLEGVFANSRHVWIKAPNDLHADPTSYSTSNRHSDFDDDRPTVFATLSRILRTKSTAKSRDFVFHPSASAQSAKRRSFT